MNILRDRLLANEKQLESKIAEAGPSDQRCDPHIISESLKRLKKELKIDTLTGPQQSNFYFRPDIFDLAKAAHVARRDNIFQQYNDYRTLASNRSICGDMLEILVDQAAQTAGGYFPIGAVGKPVLNFGNVTLPGELDLIFNRISGTQFTTLIEAKNIREWIYPSSAEVWGLINKALAFTDTGAKAVPLLACRKIQYSTRILFKTIGLLGFQCHTQYFSPTVAQDILPIKHKDGLGLHDLTTSTEPPDWMVRFFAKTVPAQAESCNERFRKNADILKAFAPDLARENLRNRYSTWMEFAQAIGISPEFDDEPDDYDY